MRIAVILIGLLLSASLSAAENPAPQTGATAEETLVPAPVEPEAAVPEQSDLILADIDADATADNEEADTGRFIPTEEISQDLGVSFPIDI
jgi:hypothetical protein